MPPMRSISRQQVAKTVSRRVEPYTSRKAVKLSGRPEKQIFKGKEISIVGDFLNGSEKVGHDKVAQWITAHRGRFVSEVTENTTHLICSIAEYKKNTLQVQKAHKLGKNKCHIVVDDWLVDCLPRESSKKRCRNERLYTVNHVLKRLRGAERKQEDYKADFDNGVKLGKELMDSKRWRIYCDSTNYDYKVYLISTNLYGRVKVQKYTLCLFEMISNFPMLYAFGAKLTSGRQGGTAYWRTDCRHMTFEDAFRAFKEFFKGRTGIEWDQRYDKLPQLAGKFKFLPPPREGMPIGEMPAGWTPPPEPVESGTSGEETSATEAGDENITYESDSGDEDEEGEGSDVGKGSSRAGSQ